MGSLVPGWDTALPHVPPKGFGETIAELKQELLAENRRSPNRSPRSSDDGYLNRSPRISPRGASGSLAARSMTVMSGSEASRRYSRDILRRTSMPTGFEFSASLAEELFGSAPEPEGARSSAGTSPVAIGTPDYASRSVRMERRRSSELAAGSWPPSSGVSRSMTVTGAMTLPGEEPTSPTVGSGEKWWSRLDSCALNEPRPIETQEEEKPHSKRNISYITEDASLVAAAARAAHDEQEELSHRLSGH